MFTMFTIFFYKKSQKFINYKNRSRIQFHFKFHFRLLTTNEIKIAEPLSINQILSVEMTVLSSNKSINFNQTLKFRSTLQLSVIIKNKFKRYFIFYPYLTPTVLFCPMNNAEMPSEHKNRKQFAPFNS